MLTFCFTNLSQRKFYYHHYQNSVLENKLINYVLPPFEVPKSLTVNSVVVYSNEVAFPHNLC